MLMATVKMWVMQMCSSMKQFYSYQIVLVQDFWLCFKNRSIEYQVAVSVVLLTVYIKLHVKQNLIKLVSRLICFLN